jgi:opacity protein-like surface antigen
MKKISIAVAAVAAVVASPALANEGRVEARGGIVWAGGGSEATAGAAVGYDFDLGETGGTFVGIEGSADKVLVSGTDVVFGVTGRLGTHTSPNGKLYATGGYSFNEGDAWHLGAGYEHKVSANVYVKAEYRHFFDSFVDLNSAVVGVGVNF